MTLDGPLTSLPRAPFPYTREAPCSRFVRELSRAAARRALWASLVHSSARGRSRLRSLRRTRAADVKGRAGVKRLERRRARGESSACGRSSRCQFHRDAEAPRGLPVSLPSAFCRSGYTRRTDRAPPQVHWGALRRTPDARMNLFSLRVVNVWHVSPGLKVVNL